MTTRTPRFYQCLLFVAVAILTACSTNRKLLSILVERPNGDVEYVYEGEQSPEDLVKEIRYFPTGDTLSVTPMKQSRVEGVVRVFHPHNIIKEQTSFVAGKQDGKFRRFDPDGALVFEGQMKNGSKEGVWTTWYDEVQMEEQRMYLNNLLHGKWTYWYADGNLRRDETYELGKLIDENNYD